MDVSVADAKNRLPALIRAMEDGETVVITRHGRPVEEKTRNGILSTLAPVAKVHVLWKTEIAKEIAQAMNVSGRTSCACSLAWAFRE